MIRIWIYFPDANKHHVSWSDTSEIKPGDDDKSESHEDDWANDEEPGGSVEYQRYVPDRRQQLGGLRHPDRPVQPHLECVVDEAAPLVVVADGRHPQVTVLVAHLTMCMYRVSQKNAT